ncbi:MULTISPECIES: glycosyltransferase [Methylobacterium]|uniref:glycosyltransferase n=1 Tax=Methylobacterium TaxID=407 RepID=UPI0013EBC24A|nr:glycosyltransferase [Methylobacterium sp. DB0501]NGM32913.1 hypothetical protein [Methylobacterium sp. DB0501]
MKWYTCCNEAALEAGGETLIAAVESCLRMTTLRPHLVYDGRANPLLSYLRDRGVVVIPHRLSFREQIENYRGQADIDYDWLLGNSLRFDIPNLEEEADNIIYTDTDVVFHRDVQLNPGSVPLAAAREIIIDGDLVRETERAFNAGVMLLNVAFMRSLHDVFRRLLIDIASGTLVNPWYDQGVLNSVCQGLWLPLPQSLNCRPFYGCEGPPAISHFQFLKPHMITDRSALVEPNPRGDVLLRRGSTAYAALRRTIIDLVTPQARSALLASCPTARLST